MAVDALPRARDANAAARCDACARRGARAVASVPARIARPSLSNGPLELANTPLESLVLLLCILQLLPIKGRLLVSQRRGQEAGAHLIAHDRAARRGRNRAHHDGVRSRRVPLLMEIVGRVDRAGRRGRSGLASTRSTAILPREGSWMGCSRPGLVRGSKVGKRLRCRRRCSVVAASGGNREARAGQERRLDYGIVGRRRIRRRGGVGDDRRIVGGTEKREFAGQTIHLSIVSRWLRDACLYHGGLVCVFIPRPLAPFPAACEAQKPSAASGDAAALGLAQRQHRLNGPWATEAAGSRETAEPATKRVVDSRPPGWRAGC